MGEQQLVYARAALFAVVVAGWAVFAATFLFRKKPPRAPESKREGVSVAGIALQAFSYAVAWALRRPFLSPFVAVGPWIEIVIIVTAIALVVGSLWVGAAAVRTLGKQWSYAARLVEGHELISEGPYRFVRHPIYTAMLGKLLATGVAWSHWIGLAAALVFFAAGTLIRVRSEEKLLRAQFGPAYDDYARRVWAVLPLSRLKG